MSFRTFLATTKIGFVTKLTTITATIAACSYISNTAPRMRRLLSSVPLTGKESYFDGAHTPLTRGFLHGGMAMFHFFRATSTGFAVSCSYIFVYHQILYIKNHLTCGLHTS